MQAIEQQRARTLSLGADRQLIPDMRSTPTLIVLFVGVLLGAVDIAIVGPALPAIQAGFEVDSSALGWVFTVYILFSLVAAPLLAKLSDVHGRRTIYVVSLALFGLGSILVAASGNFSVLLLGRAVQASGAGGLLPVAAAVVADSFPAERRGRALGLIGAVFGLAFLLGPLLGGFLLPFGWRWLFLVNIPFVAIVAAASLILLEDRPRATRVGFDWAGAATLATLLTTLAWGLSHLQIRSAGTLGMPFLAVALLAIPCFIWIERRSADPILHPELLGSKQLRIVGVIAITTGLVEASMVFLPSLAVRAFDVDAATASFMMLPLVAALIVGAPTAGLLLDRVGARPVVQLGLTLTVVGLLLFALAAPTTRSFYAAGACVGLGLSGLLGAPLRYIAIAEAGEAHRGAGQGLLTLFLGVGRIAGAALIGGVAAAAQDELSGHKAALLCLALAGVVAIGLSWVLRREPGNPATG